MTLSKEELLEEYEKGRLDRFARLRRLKNSIEEHTGLRPPRHPAEITEWWENNKPVVAKKLKAEEETQEDNE